MVQESPFTSVQGKSIADIWCNSLHYRLRLLIWLEQKRYYWTSYVLAWLYKKGVTQRYEKMTEYKI